MTAPAWWVEIRPTVQIVITACVAIVVMHVWSIERNAMLYETKEASELRYEHILDRLDRIEKTQERNMARIEKALADVVRRLND